MKPSSLPNAQSPTKASARALTPEYALLGFLSLRPTHGYDLYQQLCTELSHVWRVSMSQVYSILKRLERQGYIVGTMQMVNKRPAQKRFSLTTAGNARFQAGLSTPSCDSLHIVRTNFLTRLYFVAQLRPEHIQDLLDDQAHQARIGMSRLHEQLSHIPDSQTINRISIWCYAEVSCKGAKTLRK